VTASECRMKSRRSSTAGFGIGWTGQSTARKTFDRRFCLRHQIVRVTANSVRLVEDDVSILRSSSSGCFLATQQNALRVLVVDDDSDHASSLAMLLTGCGYDSHVCLDSQDCMAAVERLRPHVILLDLSMPGMTGFDIAQEIRHNPDLRPARLVAVTGHDQESVRQQTKTSGFDHHLLKPVAFQDLEGILRTAQRIQEMGALPNSEIRTRAYAKWEAAGRPVSNSDEEHITFWYAAKMEIMEERIQAEASRKD
jgi:CheY-like chemotaxis protein